MMTPKYLLHTIVLMGIATSAAFVCEARPVRKKTGRASTVPSRKPQPVRKPIRPAAQVRTAPVPAVSWWPDAPLGGRPLLSFDPAGGSKGNPLTLHIQSPAAQAPEHNLILETTEGAWKGRLVYFPLLYAKPASLPYLTFHSVGIFGKLNGQESLQAFYPLVGNSPFYAPRFFADGRSLVFRYGDLPLAQSATAEIYLWDIATGQTSNIGAYESASALPEMSPNTRYVAINYAGDEAPEAWQRILSISPDHWSRMLVRDIGPLGARTAKGYPFKNQWITHEGAARSIVWTSRNTLLFTMPTGKPVFNSKPLNPLNPNYTQVTEGDPRPCIAEVAPGGKPAKLIEQAYDAVPSPDNRFIACFGWLPGAKPAPDQKPGVLPPPAFYLFERKSGRRFLISNSGAGQAMWSHQGQKLMLLETRATNQKRRYELNITQWNLSDITDGVATTPKTGRLVAILSASDSGGGDERGLNSRLFEGKSVSRDSRFLFVSTNPRSGSVGAFPSHSYLLQAVDLESGQASTVAQLSDPEGRVMGWDWLDETPVAPRF